jgi:hypothetical protein
MMLPRLIVVPFVLFFVTASAWSAELHVDAAAGMDTNPGSAARPLRTLAAAMDQTVGGHTIFLQPGKYGPIAPKVGVDRNVFEGQYVTIRPAPGVVESGEKISIQRLNFGVRSGVLTGEDRKGAYDIYLRVKGVRILDGVYVYGGRHLEIIDCRIQRTPPWTGSAEAIEKFAVQFGAGDDLLVSGCEITDTAGGVAISGSRNRVVDCEIHDITHDAVRCVSSKDSLVEGNRIYNLDDGVDDGDPRGVGPDGAGWNRHCDAIHIFIPGPGIPGAQNSRLTIRGNTIFNCESQGMQFNNYLRVKDLWNEDVLIENNIFGPTRANVVNIADPVDGLVFRNNTIIRFADGRSFQGRGRTIDCKNHTFRITPRCKRTRVYNNILCNTFAISPGWFAGYNLITTVQPRGVPTRFDKIVAEAKFVAPQAFDGKLAADSPAINMGTSRFAEPPIHPTDIDGTLRDARPDCGAVEVPDQRPDREAPAPTFVAPAKVFVDDFADANTSVDPWLAGVHRKGLAWVAPKGQPSWRIQAAGDRICLSAQGQQGPSWMLTTEGDAWADVTLLFEYSNAYNRQGGGVLLRANADTEGYLVDIVGGRIVRRRKSADGQIVETVLATGSVPVPRRGIGQCHFAIKTTATGVQISADADGDGRPELSAVDTTSNAIASGRLGVYCDSPNASHRTDVVDVKVTVDREVK